MPTTLVTVPCGFSKVWDKQPDAGAVPAQDAYTGTPFMLNRQYAECFADQWLILSAKYGFITPEFIIPEPYNVTFNKRTTHPISVAELQQQVGASDLAAFDLVVGLGGKEYRQRITEAFAPYNSQVAFPFEGLPIGKMMQATKRALERGELNLMIFSDHPR